MAAAFQCPIWRPAGDADLLSLVRMQNDRNFCVVIIDIDVGMEGIMLVLICWSRAFEASVRFGSWSSVLLRILFTWSSVSVVGSLG